MLIGVNKEKKKTLGLCLIPYYFLYSQEHKPDANLVHLPQIFAFYLLTHLCAFSVFFHPFWHFLSPWTIWVYRFHCLMQIPFHLDSTRTNRPCLKIHNTHLLLRPPKILSTLLLWITDISAKGATDKTICAS